MIYTAIFHPEFPQRVEGVNCYVDGNEVPQAEVVVSNWESVGPAPFEGAEMRQKNGVLFWQDSRTLGELRAAKWDEIKIARQTSIDSPLITPYGVFDCGSEARSAISECAAQAKENGPQWSIFFTLANNSTTLLTATEMVEVWLAMGAKVQEARDIAACRRKIIDNASISELDSVIW